MTTEELMVEVDRLRGVLARIESLVWYEPQDDDDTVESVRAMVRERDEARAQVKAWQAEELSRRTERDTARAEVERLRKHFEAASPEHNLPALLDLYDARRTTAEDERDEARAEVERLRGEVESLRATAEREAASSMNVADRAEAAERALAYDAVLALFRKTRR